MIDSRRTTAAALARTAAALLVLTAVCTPVQAQPQSAALPLDVVEAYVAAQEALAADRFEPAREAIARLERQLAANDPAREPASRAARAPDIAVLRAALKPLSAALVGRPLPPGFAVGFCPMFDANRGANWIQRAGEIANPYYGSAMLRCGTIDSSPGSHMDHSPRFGGIFFMAPDAFHHVEGTHPRPGVFRLRIYDNFTELIDPSGADARAVLEEEWDAASRQYRELRAVALEPDASGRFLEAAIGEAGLPVEVTAKLRFVPGGPEERFDFIFGALSDETAGASPRPDTVIAAPPSPLFGGSTLPLSDSPAELTREILAREARIDELIAAGQFTEVFIPALEAKELALAIAPLMDPAPAPELEEALRDIVRAGWLLDWYGDLGNRQKVVEARDILKPAVAALKRLVPPASEPQ
jgi:hypothetical protein